MGRLFSLVRMFMRSRGGGGRSHGRSGGGLGSLVRGFMRRR